MQKPITTFYLQRSYWLCWMLGFIHIGGLLCLYFIIPPFWLRALLLALFLANAIDIIKVYALQQTPEAIMAFWQDKNGDWYVKKRSATIEQVLLDQPIFISNYLIVLNFVSIKPTWKIVTLIAKDALATDDFRCLKLLLKTKWTN
jgi:hypothetical protein